MMRRTINSLPQAVDYTHEVESPTKDPSEGVPMASGQQALANNVPGPLVYKVMHSTVQWLRELH